MRFVQAADGLKDLLEEQVALELDAEHLAQLAADHDQRCAEDVADQDRLGQEVGDEPQFCDTGKDRHDPDQNGGRGCRAASHTVRGPAATAVAVRMALVTSGPMMTCLEVPKSAYINIEPSTTYNPATGLTPGQLAKRHGRGHKHGEDCHRHHQLRPQQCKRHAS